MSALVGYGSSDEEDEGADTVVSEVKVSPSPPIFKTIYLILIKQATDLAVFGSRRLSFLCISE